MDQIRPFPPTDLIDQAEEEDAIRLAPAVELKDWVIQNFLMLGGELHNPDHDHISELIHDDETFLAFAWASSACMAKKRMVVGHDVEEFVGVVKRWGASNNVKRLVEVAKQAPFVSEKNITACCGTCLIN
ncbi:hypothetical protein XA39_11955 [Acinetobacter tandoii]|uniref:putative metallopeptidase n=1 Tax=Acinetobacter tandoii TaxID=202954 RepID=UPI000C2038DB|nr:putative metallopeptidase [Acinetobacter tandoii]PJG42613.1 hypothetical protein XA39_11955 [Acinetobacter tandoii]